MEHQPLTEPSPTEQPYLARRQNWTNQVTTHALMQPDAAALRFLGHTTTWADLDRRVTALAGALSRRGLDFGDRVLILMLNRTEFIEAFLAANKLGAIAVPVNFRMTPPEIAFLVSDCQARVVITEAVLAKVATAVRDIDPTLQTVIVAGSGTDDEVIGYDDLIAEPGDAPRPVDIRNDSPALIMYTSGTTGRPKGAVLTHTNIAGQAMTNLFTIGADINRDVGFIGVPLFHIAGIGNTITPLQLGLPTVVYPLGAFDPGALLDVLEAEQVTSVFLVPAQWQAVCAEQHANPRKLRLRVLSWGAAPASDTLLRDMAETFPGTQIYAAFGQTEMSPVTCMLLAQHAIRKLGVGRQGDPDSGRQGRRRGHGRCPRRPGRRDRSHALAAHPAIVEVAVIGRPDAKWGEVLVAGAAVHADLDLGDLDEFLTERLARYSIRRRWRSSTHCRATRLAKS